MSQASFHSQLSERSIKTPVNNAEEEEKRELSIKSEPEKIEDEVVESTSQVVAEKEQTIFKAEIPEERKQSTHVHTTQIVEEQLLAENIPAPVEDNVNVEQGQEDVTEQPVFEAQVVVEEQPVVQQTQAVEQQSNPIQKEANQTDLKEIMEENEETANDQSETANITDSTLVANNVAEEKEGAPEKIENSKVDTENKKKKKKSKKK